MLENYLNKSVVIEEKLYQTSSTISKAIMGSMAVGCQNRTEGVLTAIDDEFVELDNKRLIARKFIYRITLK